MRISVVTRYARKCGGAETYIEKLLAALVRSGHKLALLFESEGDRSRPQMEIPASSMSWSVADEGAELAAIRLASWAPDVIFVHGLEDVSLEERIQGIAPSVFYAHDFYGQCISGSKCWQSPAVQACTQKFGVGCLARYLPRGCGGRSPLTMLQMYRLQTRRRSLLHGYQRVLANSHFVAGTLKQQGIDAECVYLFGEEPAPTALQTCKIPDSDEPWQLLFLGRAEALKGGDYLLRALPLVAQQIPRRLSLTFAGTGSALPQWQELAASIRNERIQIAFAGWTTSAPELLSRTHLLIMPSVWPEPFGLSGLEAASHGVPTVAFATGGIPEWLRDGYNGHLAPANPPTPEGLADAICHALSDSERYLWLRKNALACALEFSLARHLGTLLPIFEQVAASANEVQFTPELTAASAPEPMAIR